MPTVLVTGPTVKHNSQFSSLAVAVTIASTHFANPRRDDQAELALVAWLNTNKVYATRENGQNSRRNRDALHNIALYKFLILFYSITKSNQAVKEQTQ